MTFVGASIGPDLSPETENEKLRLMVETVRAAAEGLAKQDDDSSACGVMFLRLLKDLEAGDFPTVTREESGAVGPTEEAGS